MFKLLVVEDNIKQSKQIINYISQNDDDTKLYCIAYNYQEAIDIIKNKDIDIILLDLNLPDTSGIEIIKYIEKNKINKYYNSIFVVSGRYDLITVVQKSPYVFSYITKPYSLNNILENLKSIIKLKKSKDILQKINNELKKLHYNFSYNGTRYLAETIYEIYKRDNENSDNLKKYIYPIIADKHKKTINTICGNIKQATNSMYFDCDEETLKKYFNYSYCTKPKVKEIIFTVLNNITK